MKKLVIGLMAATVLGCAGAPADAAPRKQVVQVSDDKFSKEATLVGVVQAVNPFGGTFRMWRIRSWVQKDTRAVTHQLYVVLGYSAGGWRWYDRAADDAATTLQVVRIASNVTSCMGGCSYSETIGVELQDAALRDWADKGFQIKLSAKSGDSLILDVTPEQIREQLAAIDRYVGGATSGPPAEAVIPGVSLGVDLGVGFGDVPQLNKSILGRPDMGGVLVSWVKSGSVASRAGVKWTDILLEYDGVPIAGADDFKAKLASTPVGKRVSIKLIRGRKEQLVEAQF